MPRITKSFKSLTPTSADDLVGEPGKETGSDFASPVTASTSTTLSVNVSEESQDFKDKPRDFSRNDSYNNGGYRAGGDERSSDRDVPTEDVSGVLDIMLEGHGFLRPKYIPSDRDVYISASQIRRFQLRPGDFVEGAARPPKENERYFGLLQVNKINSKVAESFVSEDGKRTKRVRFEDLTAIYPNKHIKLETGKAPLSQRVIDLVAPIGFGQRGLIVSPPKAGKTTILKD